MMDKVKEVLLKRVGDVAGMRVSIDKVSDKHKNLAIGLFELGAKLVATDRDKTAVQELSKVIQERSGSMQRYRTVPFGNIQLEPADIFLRFDENHPEVNPNEIAYARLITGAEFNAKPSAEPPAQ